MVMIGIITIKQCSNATIKQFTYVKQLNPKP